MGQCSGIVGFLQEISDAQKTIQHTASLQAHKVVFFRCIVAHLGHPPGKIAVVQAEKVADTVQVHQHGTVDQDIHGGVIPPQRRVLQLFQQIGRVVLNRCLPGKVVRFVFFQGGTLVGAVLIPQVCHNAQTAANQQYRTVEPASGSVPAKHKHCQQQHQDSPQQCPFAADIPVPEGKPAVQGHQNRQRQLFPAGQLRHVGADPCQNKGFQHGKGPNPAVLHIRKPVEDFPRPGGHQHGQENQPGGLEHGILTAAGEQDHNSQNRHRRDTVKAGIFIHLAGGGQVGDQIPVHGERITGHLPVQRKSCAAEHLKYGGKQGHRGNGNAHQTEPDKFSQQRPQGAQLAHAVPAEIPHHRIQYQQYGDHVEEQEVGQCGQRDCENVKGWPAPFQQVVRPQQNQRKTVHGNEKQRLDQCRLDRPGTEGVGHCAQQGAEAAVAMMQAERKKSQTGQVDAQQYQDFQQLLPVLAGYQRGQQVQRVTHHIIAEGSHHIRAKADAHIPGGDGCPRQQATGGLPQPAPVIDQRRIMLLDRIPIPDEGFPVRRKNGNPYPGQQGKKPGKGHAKPDHRMLS